MMEDWVNMLSIGYVAGIVVVLLGGGMILKVADWVFPVRGEEEDDMVILDYLWRNHW